MKTYTVFAVSAVLAVVSIDSAMGMASYLQQLPNGDSFAKALGHKGDSGYTDFGNAFSKAGAKWSADFCKQTFPGTSMTNGAAFGDPCCTWTAGGKPDFTVTAFTDKPTQETKCASFAAPSEVPGTTSSSPLPAVSSEDMLKPSAAVTPVPATTSTSSITPTVRPAKCGVKKETDVDDSDLDGEVAGTGNSVFGDDITGEFGNLDWGNADGGIGEWIPDDNN